MPRTITPATSLDTLRKEAKRWLKALRAGDADARVRFERAHPAAPASPVLRDVQHALAREYGTRTAGCALKQALVKPHAERTPTSTWRARTAERVRAPGPRSRRSRSTRTIRPRSSG